MRTPRQSAQLLLLSAGSLCAAMLGAQTPATQPAPPTQSATIHHPRPTAAHPAATASVEPPPPPIPDWPINDQPSPAAVEFDASGLHIYATNSSLQQILAAVTLATGSKVDGFAKDQRVYGNFGPGQPREVLAQLLQGSGYNIVMVGDQGHGAPREILLSSRSATSGVQPGGNRNQSQADNDDDSNDNQVEFQPPQPAQQMQPQQGPPGRQGFGGSDGNGPQRTPQQIQQELMQRQQQLLQQQQQQLQQTTTPPPNQ